MPGLYLLLPGVLGVPGVLWLFGAFPPRDFLGAFVASNFLGAFPPVDFRAVIFALVMGAIFGLLRGLRGVTVFWNLKFNFF